MSSPQPQFRFNPITGQLDLSDVAGGGGGDVTLIPDEGSNLTGSSLPVLGQKANSAQVMQTLTAAGNFLIQNNVWDTAYVVDQSTDNGTKGTYSTLQDAVDAIVADGVATSDQAGIIRVRPGVYVLADPVVIPPNVIILIKGDSPSGGIGNTNWQSDVYINGNITNDDTSTLYLYNLFISPDTGDGITSNGPLLLYNCTVNSATLGGFINAQGCFGTWTLIGASLNASYCNQLSITIQSGSAYFHYCNTLSINQDTGLSQVIVWGSNGVTCTGNPAALSTLFLYDTPVSAPISTTAEMVYAGNLTANSAGLSQFFDNAVIPSQLQRLKGNCYLSRIVSGDTSISPYDYFIGVQGNSGAVNISLSATGLSKGIKWQSWRIADLEGTAATNPITINVTGGTINNASSYSISSNFGAIEIYFDGTNFFVSGSTSNAEFSEPIGELAYFTNKNGDAYLSGLWLKCDGSILLQSTYPTLYSRMGLINEGGINWTLRTSGTTSTANAATFGASKHLIAGVNGMLRSSTDGITWATRTSGFSASIRSLTFGGGNFIYGGDQGALATSTDGITWQTKNPSIGNSSAPNQGNFGPFLAYNSGTIVGAIRDTGGIVTSTDGVTWTTRDSTLGTTSSCGGIVYGGGQFVAAFFGGAITTSTDGITWVPQTTGTTSAFCGMAYTNNLYIAIPNSGGTFYSSTDAITWTPRASGIGGNPVNAICFGAGVYLAVGFAGNRSSTDLVTWGNFSPGTVINTLVYNGTIFVGGAANGSIRTSTDGVTWSAQTSQTTSTICCLIYTGSLHVYGTAGGGIGTSTDGITWVARTSGTTSTIWSLVYDGTLYHASGLHYTLTSTDAITWTTNTGYSGTTSTILSTAYGNSTYVYGTVGGRVATSPDTLVWTPQTSGTTSNVNALRYGTVFVYATAGGGLSTSTDGVTWTARTSGTTSDINALTYGALYVYAGAGGVLASSTDAITWTTRTSGTTSALNTLRYANDFYIAAGAGGVTLQSNGAVTWYSRVSTTTSTINASSTGAGVFVESGFGGAVQTALNDYPYDRTTQFQLPTDSGILITTEAATNFFRSLYIKALN